jgi:ABC-2 type transport system permease protein
LSLSRFLLVLAKEFRHVIRNKRVLMISLMMPVLVMFLVGYAFSGDIKHVPIAIVDEDKTPASRALTDLFQVSDTFHVTETGLDRSQAEAFIRDGIIKVAVIVPDGFQSDLKNGHATIYLLLDGSDPVIAGMAGPTLEATASTFSPSIKLSTIPMILFNPKLRYVDFLAPSIVGLITQFLPTFLMAISLAGERERGTIEQLVVTPITGFELLLGKMSAYVVIGCVEAALALAIAVEVFGLTIRGNIILVAAFILLFTVASLSVGALSSVFAKNQIQAIQQIIPVIYVSIFLSGVFYPLESMPDFLRPVAYLIPLTYMNHALRALIIRGAGFEVVLTDFAALGIYTVTVLTLAVLLFKKRLE